MNNVKDVLNKQKGSFSWFGTANDYDCIVGRKLNDSYKRELRNNFSIPLDEEILFMRDTSFWNDKNQGAVFTDRGIYVICDNDNPQDEFIIEWKEFDQVIYQELVFYFFNGNTQVASLHYDYILKCNDNDVNSKWSDVCNMLNNIAQTQEADLDPLDLAAEDRLQEAFEITENLLVKNPESFYPHFCKGRLIYLEQSELENINEERVQEGIDEMNLANSFEVEGSTSSVIHRNIGYLYHLLGQSYNARYSFIRALENTDEPREVVKLIDVVESDLKDIWDNYTETYDYNDRKFCMMVRDNEIGGCVVPSIDVFRMSNVPIAYKFPVGHPYPNQLYIGHPYNKSLYVPYEESEDTFFMDKVNELCYLLECLGAESIEITSIKGKQIEEINKISNNVSGAADVKLFSGNVQTNQKNNLSSSMDSRTARTYTIHLDPMSKPYLPDNLVWYPEQPQWQRLVERRINNNILEYAESVQSSETRFTSSSEMVDVKAAAEYLWTKVNANIEVNKESQFKTSTDTVWNIKVKFRSLKDFEKVENSDSTSSFKTEFSEEEKEYLEELRFCLEEDSTLSPKEERMLERLRVRLGINEDRANELRALLIPKYTPEEQEYLDEVKACLEDDGHISDRELRMLDRMANRLGITPERAKDIRIKLGV